MLLRSASFLTISKKVYDHAATVNLTCKELVHIKL
jgi:hypothetical protein